MKYGSDDLQKKYRFHHSDLECDGKWYQMQVDMPYRIDDGLMVMITNAPVVKCDKCDSMFFADGFEELFLKQFAEALVLNKRNLFKPEIRFLRTYLGLTQKQMAEELGISDTDMSKYESIKAKDQRHMDDGLIVQLKVLVAGKLGLHIPPDKGIWKVEKLRPIEKNIFDASRLEVC